MFRRSLLATVALLASVVLASAQTLPLPGIPGPSLGDFNTNLYTLTKGVEAGSTVGVGSALSVDQSSGQSNCTQLGTVNMVHDIKTSASTGYVCLPAAVPGFYKVIMNETGQSISIYGGGTSANQYLPGTQDTINGTVGSTPFTGLIAHAQAICVVGTGGAWTCSVGSNNVTGAGAFTTLSASGTVSGAGFTALFASPPALGTTAPAAVESTTLLTTGLTSLGTTTPVHLVAGQTTPPTISTCGTGAVVGNATDVAGEVHATGATACTVSWTGTFTDQPYCVATDNTTAAALKLAYVSTTGFTISGLTSGDTFSYHCIGQAGG